MILDEKPKARCHGRSWSVWTEDGVLGVGTNMELAYRAWESARRVFMNMPIKPAGIVRWLDH